MWMGCWISEHLAQCLQFRTVTIQNKILHTLETSQAGSQRSSQVLEGMSCCGTRKPLLFPIFFHMDIYPSDLSGMPWSLDIWLILWTVNYMALGIPGSNAFPWLSEPSLTDCSRDRESCNKDFMFFKLQEKKCCSSSFPFQPDTSEYYPFNTSEKGVGYQHFHSSSMSRQGDLIYFWDHE